MLLVVSAPPPVIQSCPLRALQLQAPSRPQCLLLREHARLEQGFRAPRSSPSLAPQRRQIVSTSARAQDRDCPRTRAINRTPHPFFFSPTSLCAFHLGERSEAPSPPLPRAVMLYFLARARLAGAFEAEPSSVPLQGVPVRLILEACFSPAVMCAALVRKHRRGEGKGIARPQTNPVLDGHRVKSGQALVATLSPL